MKSSLHLPCIWTNGLKNGPSIRESEMEMQLAKLLFNVLDSGCCGDLEEFDSSLLAISVIVAACLASMLPSVAQTSAQSSRCQFTHCDDLTFYS